MALPTNPVNANGDTSKPFKAFIKLRLRLPLLWLAFLMIGALLLPDRVWMTLLVGFGGLFVVAYFWVWQMSRGLSASRRLRFGWVAVGDRLSEEFMIINRSELPALWVEIMDQSNVPGYKAAVVRSVGARQFDQFHNTQYVTSNFRKTSKVLSTRLL